ncbi:hypothetical protein [Streptomyces radicis]|uniref:Translation initiation factor 2 n=1 Tax=Streptomyces radicis TaxID=1750517 RepID=A0A3A9VTD8_9ACTN|nr:hypothetical protein [Streptomyces radicis]RKN04255.1 hypothetical protein D7319_29135 [Streptomyces radicis]RKN14773.1 hypothetical protein D7318_28895 [Streptomyces radicis]
MNGSGPPADITAARWKTFATERAVLAVARTVTSTARLLEVLPGVFGGDPRVEVTFGEDRSSAFHAGVTDLLRASGVRVIPWENATSQPSDLVITASENARFDHVEAPVLILPHGIGFQKLVPDARGPERRLSGVVPPSLLAPLRSWYAVSHPTQTEQLATVRPDLADRTLVVGDPCHDRLLASLPLRDRYRRALGLPEGPVPRLVLLASTWGGESLIGSAPELPRRLLAELPLDEYRVAATLHPNVWFGHSPWQLRTIQRDALDAGLILIPPFAGWQAALAAADVVVGDHGSLSLYAAAAEKPLLLAAFGEESVPGTAMAALGRAAPPLDPGKGLREQIEEAIERHRLLRYRDIVRRAFHEPGRALPRLRSAVYDLLGLAEPPLPVAAARPYPAPAPESTESTAEVVVTRLAREEGVWAVDVRRHPAASRPERPESARCFSHLASEVTGPGRSWAESASVLTVDAAHASPDEAARRIDDVLRRHPFCRIAAVALASDGVLLGRPDGRRIRAEVAGALAQPRLVAAIGYACLRAGIPAEGVFLLRVGERSAEVRLRPWPAP